MNRCWSLLPLLLSGVALSTQEGCGSGDPSTPPMPVAGTEASGDAARADFDHDASAMLAAAKGRGGSTAMGTESVHPEDLTGTILSAARQILCAALQSTVTATAPAPAPAPAPASTSFPYPKLAAAFHFSGGPVTVTDQATGAPIPRADMVWDLEKAQAAAFIDVTGGIGAGLALAGTYDGQATGGKSAGVLASWTGLFVAGVATAQALTAEAGSAPTVSSYNAASGVTAIASATAAADMVFPSLATSALPAAHGYVPWDLATTTLAQTVKGGTLQGAAGARYLAWTDTAAATAGVQIGTQIMIQSNTTALDSPAGHAALIATANSTAKKHDVGLDVLCAGAGAPSRDSQACVADASACTASGTHCLPNGEAYCCRAYASGTSYCLSNAECTGGQVCSPRSDGKRVCAAKATCR